MRVLTSFFLVSGSLFVFACSKGTPQAAADAGPSAPASPSAAASSAASGAKSTAAAADPKAEAKPIVPVYGATAFADSVSGTFAKADEVKTVKLGASRPNGGRLLVKTTTHNVEIALWQDGRSVATCKEDDPDRLPKECVFDVAPSDANELRARHVSFDDITPTNHYNFSWQFQPLVSKEAKLVKASDTEVAAHKSYLEALNEGRKLTQQKKYAEAIGAFDRALKHEPDNAQGLGERGYALLLSGDLDRARLDLEAAAKHTQDPKLLSTIEFNFGLVMEKRGEKEAAHAHFAKANVLKPTEAAKKKLALMSDAAQSCGVTQSSLKTEVKRFSSWSEAFQSLQHRSNASAPSDDAAAREALTSKCIVDDMINTFPEQADAKQCNTVTDDGKARVIRYEDVDGAEHFAVAIEGQGGLRVMEDEALLRASGRCGPPGYQLLLTRVGERLALRVYSIEVMPVQLCTEPGRDPNDAPFEVCEGKFTEVVGSACGDPSWYSRYDAVIDPSAGKFLMRLDGWVTLGAESKKPLAELGAAKLTIGESGVDLARGACTQTLKY